MSQLPPGERKAPRRRKLKPGQFQPGEPQKLIPTLLRPPAKPAKRADRGWRRDATPNDHTWLPPCEDQTRRLVGAGAADRPEDGRENLCVRSGRVLSETAGARRLQAERLIPKAPKRGGASIDGEDRV